MHIPHNPADGIYQTNGDWIHAVEVVRPERFLHTAGTMGLEIDGTARLDLDRQLVLLWDNLRRILADADMTVDNIVRVTSYLRDVSYAGPNGDARVAALGGRAVATTAVVVGTLQDDWLVELEVVAAA